MAAPSISTPILRLFRRIVRRYFRRHFHGVRISGASRLQGITGPLIVYANHSSWWDPMVAILLAEELMPERSHFAPMDEEALSRYGILRKVGIFPIEMKTARGAAQFLRRGLSIVDEGGVLWITPQGRFVDPHVRPLEFKPGLASLAARIASSCGVCTLLPLAIEYTFWDERLPEVLLRFGEPVSVLRGATPEKVQERLVGALVRTMDRLRNLAASRDASAFSTLARGAVGVGGFYAIGQRLKALLLRRPYRAEHTIMMPEDATRTLKD